VLISAKGLPILEIPLPINLETGEFVWLIKFILLNITFILVFKYKKNHLNSHFSQKTIQMVFISLKL